MSKAIQRHRIYRAPHEELRVKLNHDNNHEWIAWWVAGIAKNERANSQPIVWMCFRKLENDILTDEFKYCMVPLTSLGQVRLGTIWQNGVCNSEISFDVATFNINYNPDQLQYISFYDARKNHREAPFDKSVYRMQNHIDKAWLLRFTLENGGYLLVPCTEYFSRCYGTSQELKRVLATYTWEEALKRLFATSRHPEDQRGWTVSIGYSMNDSDRVFLAHVKYDRHTERAAKEIHSQIQTTYQKTESRIPQPNLMQVKVRPWFLGKGMLRVRGIQFNDNKSFLALQIIGANEPPGRPILWERENPGKTAPLSPEETPEAAWSVARHARMNYRHHTPEITNNSEPGHNTATFEIDDPDFVILGERRTVIPIEKTQKAPTAGPRGNDTEEVTNLATGEPKGDGNHTGRASISSPLVVECKGNLLDIWDALLHVAEKYKEFNISSVEWYAGDAEFISSEEPKLVSLSPFKTEDMPRVVDANWLFYDLASSKPRPRGVLVARLNIKERYIYFVELERRPINRYLGDGSIKKVEESYTGMIFTLRDETLLKEWLDNILSEIRFVKGVFRKIVAKCPGKADIYRHRPTKSDTVPQESVIVKELRKLQ